METISVLSIISAADGTAAGKPAAPSHQPGRPDALTAQKVEVAIILQAMLGTQTAEEYLKNNAVDAAVGHRVLHQPQHRRGRHDAFGILC
jgi:hypothetical protein